MKKSVLSKAKMKSTQKATRKKPAIKPKAKKAAASKFSKLPPGFSKEGGLYLPTKISKNTTVVPPSKMLSGIKKAKAEISSLLDEISSITSGYSVSEIELAVSFSADGKFLGIGVGGATSITIKLSPEE
ncbi:MAG: hypothetical protein EP312_04095 [Gammaproteobacteria bacterium]|nr:MAG: hypothetical protein EP312_04095 [Gammaproteobacteria bacterium]